MDIYKVYPKNTESATFRRKTEDESKRDDFEEVEIMLDEKS